MTAFMAREGYPVKYEFLTQAEMDDHIAEAMRGRELEHYYRSVNAANYTEILKTAPVGDYRTRIEKMHSEELDAMVKEEEVYNALALQLADPVARVAAKARLKAKLSTIATKAPAI